MATGMNTVYEPLIDHGDIDGLVRLVDDYCSSRNWAQLLALRNACKAATQTGRQLWPVSTLAEYRLALLAPAETAAQVLGEDAGRFTIGPLTEVVAQHHQFVDIEPHLPHDPRTSFVAYECAIRGQYIDNEESLFEALEIPFTIGEWEACSPPLRKATLSPTTQVRLPSVNLSNHGHRRLTAASLCSAAMATNMAHLSGKTHSFANSPHLKVSPGSHGLAPAVAHTAADEATRLAATTPGGWWQR